jgi:hypothetical protein
MASDLPKFAVHAFTNLTSQACNYRHIASSFRSLSASPVACALLELVPTSNTPIFDKAQRVI